MPNASHAPAGDALPAVFAAAGSRREFLRRMSLASAAPLAAGPLLAQLDDASAVKPGRKLKVVIAGAGLAGLCAAYELEKRGHEYVILEADGSHIGGRVRTLRLQDGLDGEAVAMRVPEEHQITRHYLQELGVGLRPFVYTNENAWCNLRGHRARLKDVSTLTQHFKLTEREQKMSPTEMSDASVVIRLKQMSEVEKRGLLATRLSTPCGPGTGRPASVKRWGLCVVQSWATHSVVSPSAGA